MVIYAKVVRIVSVVSGLIFVGSDICWNPQYIDVAVNFTLAIMTGANQLKVYPAWMKPIAAKFNGMVRMSREKRKMMMDLLKPLYEQRCAILRDGAEKLPNDGPTWSMKALESKGLLTLEHFTDLVLLLLVGTIHTTTYTTTRM